MKDLKEKIEDFTNTIKESKEFKDYYKAKEEFEKDKDANELFKNFQKAQQELSILIHGKFDGEEKQRKEVEKLFNKVKENKKINNWLETQKKLQILIGKITIEISNSLKFPFSLPSKCSGGCSC